MKHLGTVELGEPFAVRVVSSGRSYSVDIPIAIVVSGVGVQGGNLIPHEALRHLDKVDIHAAVLTGTDMMDGDEDDA